MNVNQKIAVVVLLQLMLSSTGHTASDVVNAPMDAAGVDLHNLQEYMEQERVARQIKEDRERIKSKIESGDTVTWDTGENEVVVKVTGDDGSNTYTVTVTAE